MKSFKFLCVGVIACLATTLFSSWGFLVHKTTSQLAIYQLPKEIQSFFYINKAYLVENATRPDQRRNKDKSEATKHFIDLEDYGTDAAHKLPLHWEDAIKQIPADTFLKYGHVPYHVVYMKNKLTQAFKDGNADSILFYAADMGHYIEDAHVPLHTTNNYDGQMTDQKGIHALWESVVPEIEISHYNLYSNHKATYLQDPALAIWTAVRHSNELLPDVLAKETEVTKQFSDETKYKTQNSHGKPKKYYTTAFAKAYSDALKTTINDQLLSASNLLADFWFTAWVDAGKPSLESITKPSFSSDNKKDLKKELKSFKKNNLLKDELLLAKDKEDKKKEGE